MQNSHLEPFELEINGNFVKRSKYIFPYLFVVHANAKSLPPLGMSSDWRRGFHLFLEVVCTFTTGGQGVIGPG